MKVVILAGGFGTRLAEETSVRPKPMIEVGDKPILWHIMKLYSHHGFNDFVILLGYKGFVIKEYFSNYLLHQSSVSINLKDGSSTILNHVAEPWTVTLLETGAETMTGGRIKRAEAFLRDEPFLLTYGDGVGDIDISGLVEFHRSHGKAVTMTSTQPDGRFGAVHIGDDEKVTHFTEKPRGDGGWINAGFFVCQPSIFTYLTAGDATVLEQEPLRNLAQNDELYAYKHRGFWRPMDTLRDKQILEAHWRTGAAPWKVWKDV